MEPLEELFRSSIETDRNFAVQPSRWHQLENKLDDAERKWNRHFPSILLIVGMILFSQLLPGTDSHVRQLGSFPILRETSGPVQHKIVAGYTGGSAEKGRVGRAGIQRLNSSDHSPVSDAPVATLMPEPLPASGLTREEVASLPTMLKQKTEQSAAATAEGLLPDADRKEVVAPQRIVQTQVQDQEGTKRLNAGKSVNLLANSSERTVRDSTVDVLKATLPSLAATGRATSPGGAFIVRTPVSGSAIGLLLPPDTSPHPVPERRPESNWQLSLQFGGLYDNSPRSIEYYTAGSGGGQLTQIYTFPSGDTTRLYFNGRILEKQLRMELGTVRLGLQRVFPSGIGTRIALLYARGNDNNADLTTLIPSFSNRFYFVEQHESRFLVGELGVNYTLLRDRRLQPFFGLVSILNFATSTETRRFAQYPEQDYRQLEYRIINRSRQLTPGFYLELGAQWLLTDHWSIGANLACVTVLQTANNSIGGLGLEIRYRW